MQPFDDSLSESLARELRRVPQVGDVARARTMAAVRREAQRPRRLGWLSPVLGAALAASLTIVVAGGALLGSNPLRTASVQAATPTVSLGSSLRDSLLLVRFAFAAPAAARVALVGDFNDWGSRRTALARSANGVWVGEVAMARGRHRYAYVVDDTGWVTDAVALDTLPNGRRAARLELVNQE